MRQKKYAVFTMDVETFADTECIRASGVPVADDLMDGLDEYIRIMDRHGCMRPLAELVHQPLCCGHLDHAFPDHARPRAHPQVSLPYPKPFEKKKISGTVNNHRSGDSHY